MKKFTKLAAVAAVCAAFGAFALGGCGGGTAAMTEEDAASLNAAFIQARAYDGSYTLNEDYSSYVYYLSSTQYSRGDATVTYDNGSGNMGYAISVEGDDESYSMGYYTVPQGDGSIKQYVDFMGYKISNSYSAGEDVELYYTSYAECLENLFGLDIAEGSSITTVEGFVSYWQDFLGESINSLGEYYGITLSFTDVEATVESSENGFVFTFSSDAALAAGGTFMGVEISAYTADYSLSVKVEDSFITEINSAVNQNLTMSYGGQTVTMKGVANSKDTFTLEYDSSVIPSDFSDYETYEDTEGTI